ncbi:YafY family transcriptional regulator [Clostridium bornimense]|uniref:helix-turn-helix transcriptional regulator n=1 Tax=Clostridium bornimense TaxID=1216932 RepID=UPI001C10B690|nr:YafY family protein [Clostridium bornimense]MBU5314989.1 YafY family transcriptional regulator [Clostridium bornimense]
MRFNRLFEIIYILINKRTITAKELADKFEVSQRTIYRDIDLLSSAGIPIYTTKGKGGGIGILDNYVLNKSMLSEGEQNEIIAALQGLSAINYTNVDDVLSKVSEFFGKSNEKWIEVDFSDWSENQKEKFNIIKESIIKKEVISIEYYSSYGEKSKRVIEPLQLMFKGKSWYIVAFCRVRESIRIFKINRIRKIEVLEERFTRCFKKDMDMEITEPSDIQCINMKMRVDASQGYRVYDEFSEDEIYKEEDGSFIVSTTYPIGSWVYSYILSYGSYAEVIEPQYLRDEIRKLLRETLNKYL